MATMIQRSRRVPPAEKAAFHEIVGAGRSKVKRPFFGINDREAEQLMRYADQRISLHIQRGDTA